MIWNLHTFSRTPSELYGIIQLDLMDKIEGRWNSTLAIEKELRIKALMEVQHELDFDQASLMAEECIQHFKISNRTGRVAVGEIREVHTEGVALWKEIMDQQKKVEEEIEQETK